MGRFAVLLSGAAACRLCLRASGGSDARHALGSCCACRSAARRLCHPTDPTAARPGTAEGNPYLWLLATLATLVGLPFFTLSANAPLLQLWFGWSGHWRSADPYFLYGASNAGSLGALLAYPVLIEPLLPLPVQSRAWNWGFLALVLAIVGCGLVLLARERQGLAPPGGHGDQASASAPTWSERLTWVFLSFVPSGLLVAYTTYLTTDLASAPLLWVLPLAFYLATFIAVFRQRMWGSLGGLLVLQPLVVAGALAAYEWKGDYSWIVLCPRRAVGVPRYQPVVSRPALQAPTRGGASDGLLPLHLARRCARRVFAALLAPQLFTGTLEFPVLLGLGMLARPKLWRTLETGRSRIRLGLLLGAAVGGIFLLQLLLVSERLLKAHADLRLQVICGLGLAVVAATRWPQPATAVLAAMIAAAAALPSASAPIYVQRSFRHASRGRLGRGRLPVTAARHDRARHPTKPVRGGARLASDAARLLPSVRAPGARP